MQAVIAPAYGPPGVVRVVDRPDPVPGPGKILVAVRAATVSTGDAWLRSGTAPRGFGLIIRAVFGIRRLRNPVLGQDLAGEVVAVGAGVTRFRPGDAVIAETGPRMGGHAALAVLPETGAIAPMPAGLTWEEAAAVPFGGGAALHFLDRAGRPLAGARLLVLGAAGAVGSAAVQIARAAGAEVTAHASVRHHALLAGLGAAVIDRHAQPFDRLPGRWDVILDAVGAARWPDARARLGPGGRFLRVAADLPQMLHALALSGAATRPVVGTATGSAASLARLAALADAGRLRPVIDRVFPVAEAAAAHARVEERAKAGSVVLRFP